MTRQQKIELLRQVIGFNLNMDLTGRQAERILNDIERNHEMKFEPGRVMPVENALKALVRKVNKRNPRMTSRQIADMFNVDIESVTSVIGSVRRA